MLEVEEQPEITRTWEGCVKADLGSGGRDAVARLVNIDGALAFGVPLIAPVYPSTTDVAATGGRGCGSYSPATCRLAPSVTAGPAAGVKSAKTR
jgi:hypothetical protein